MIKQALVQRAVAEFKKLRQAGQDIQPIDGFVAALEEIDFDGDFTREEYDEYVQAVTDACVKAGLWQTEPEPVVEGKYELLPIGTLTKKFRDFAACANDWNTLSEEDAKSFCASAYQVTVRIGQPREYLIWDNAQKHMADGIAISLPIGFLRLKTGLPKCPRCGNSIMDTGALSRIDNETVLCSDCGMREAMEDYGKYRHE